MVIIASVKIPQRPSFVAQSMCSSAGPGAPSIAHGAGAIRNLHPQHQQPEGDPPALTTNVPSEGLLSPRGEKARLARDERACLGAPVLQARAGARSGGWGEDARAHGPAGRGSLRSAGCHSSACADT